MTTAISVLLESAGAGHADPQKVKERCSSLKTALEAYETAAKSLDDARLTLRTALLAVWELIGDETLKAPEPPPAPKSDPDIAALLEHAATVGNENAVAVRPPASSPRPVMSEVRPEDVRGAERVVAEINALAQTDLSKEHELRLGHLLQALTAEARLYTTRLPQYHVAHRACVGAFRTIANIKEDRGVTIFLKGLSRDARGDWASIAAQSRRLVERFDMDANAAQPDVPKSTPKPKRKESEIIVDAPKLSAEPRFPRLIRASKEGEIMLIGGLRIQEKVEYVRDLGIDCEWYEIQKDAPRSVQAIGAKIDSRKASAVIILEHFMSHSTFQTLKARCNATGTPYAHAGKAGTGAIDLALMALEMRIPN